MSIRANNISNDTQSIAFGIGGSIAAAGIILLGCGLAVHVTSATVSGIAVGVVGGALIAGSIFYDRLKQAKEKMENQTEAKKFKNDSKSEGNRFIYDTNL